MALLAADKIQKGSQASTGVILVAANSRVNQRLVSGLLQKRGYTVIVAGDGVQALDALEQNDVRLLLMDVQMPNLDGIEATQRIRQDSRWSDLPIVAMTSRAREGYEDSYLSAGMNGLLSKPIHAAHLLRVVEKFARFGHRAAASD
jgi:CheY-like chemotaxis protein